MSPLLLPWLAGAAAAGGWTGAVELGLLPGLSRDLPPRRGTADTASFGIGPSLIVPVSGRYGWTPASPPLRLRAALEMASGRGSDRVEWVDDGVRYEDEDHMALFTSARLLAGPELRLPARTGAIERIVGVGVGGGWVGTWHSFSGAGAAVMDPALNDLGSPWNIDPYSSQLVAAAGVHALLRLPLGPGMAVECEAGYTVSYVPVDALARSVVADRAVRAGYGLDLFRLGCGVGLLLRPSRKDR